MTKLFGFRLYAVGAMALTLASTPCLLAQNKSTKAEAAAAAPVAVALPQYASITSTDNTIQVSRMPVIDNGNIAYVDVTLAIAFGVDAEGHPTVDVVPPVVTSSPTLLVNNFKAGTYVGPSNVEGGQAIIVVSGPSPLAGGGTGWTLTTPSGSSGYTYPSTAIWYSEPVTSNPLYSRITAAKITAATANAYSFGEGDSGSTPNASWGSNSLIGFNQVGNTLIVSCFSSFNGNDYPTPIDTITYTLQQ